ncbi:MAG: AraC family transcriptional regulator [Polyangiaceae bacterium]|nr:AraC family transcriptional regulator [Polyangiaceae bacterium]
MSLGTMSTVSLGGILNPRAEGVRFFLARHAPSPDLAYFVERHWSVRWDLEEPYPQETLPQPCVNLVFEEAGARFYGLGTKRFSVMLSGKGWVFGTKFRPGAFRPIWRRPMVDLVDRAAPLRDVLGGASDGVWEAVREAGDDDACALAVEALLRATLPQEKDPEVEVVASIVKLALDNPGMGRVEELAAASGQSPRALQRLFRRYLGVGPKWVIRRFRLHEAAARVAEGGDIHWASLAQDLGYFDQAHFIKDFKDQVGQTPTEYARRCNVRTSLP